MLFISVTPIAKDPTVLEEHFINKCLNKDQEDTNLCFLGGLSME